MDEANGTRTRLRAAAFFALSVLFLGAVIGLSGQVYWLENSIKLQLTASPGAPTPGELRLGEKISVTAWVLAGALGVTGAIMLARALLGLHRIKRIDRQKR